MQNFNFHPKRPSTVSSITELLRTCPFNVSVFWTKYARLRETCKIFIFLPETSQHRIKYHRVLLNLYIQFFGVLDKNMWVYSKYAKFLLFAQYGPAPDQVWQNHLEPQHSIFRYFGQKYASYCEICKILISTENRPSPVLRITESPKTSRLVISLFQIKIYKFMRDRQNFHFLLKCQL